MMILQYVAIVNKDLILMKMGSAAMRTRTVLHARLKVLKSVTPVMRDMIILQIQEHVAIQTSFLWDVLIV